MNDMKLHELVQAIADGRGWKITKVQAAFDLEVPQDGGKRSQVVSVTEFDDSGASMARFTTKVGKADALDGNRQRSALELNFRLPHGCLAIDGTHLVMTDTRPLKTTTPQTSGDSIEFLARQADLYEKQIFGTDEH